MIPSQKHDCTKRMVVPVVCSVGKKSTKSNYSKRSSLSILSCFFLYCTAWYYIWTLSQFRKKKGPRAKTTSTRCLYKANVYSLKYVRFVQRKKQINKIFFPHPDVPQGRARDGDQNNMTPERTGDKKEMCLPTRSRPLALPIRKGGLSLVFLNQGLKSSQFFEARSGLKRLGICTKRIPLRSWAQSSFSRNPSKTSIAITEAEASPNQSTRDSGTRGREKNKYMYGELFLLYPTNSEDKRKKGTTCLNFIYNQGAKSSIWRHKSLSSLEAGSNPVTWDFVSEIGNYCRSSLLCGPMEKGENDALREAGPFLLDSSVGFSIDTASAIESSKALLPWNLLANQAIPCPTGGKTLENKASAKENLLSVGLEQMSNLTNEKWSAKDVLCLEGLIKHMNQHEISFVGIISSPFLVPSPEHKAFLSVHLSNTQLYCPFGPSVSKGRGGPVQGGSLHLRKKNLDIINPFFFKIQGINSNFLLYF